jgi:hypothetical protein
MPNNVKHTVASSLLLIFFLSPFLVTAQGTTVSRARAIVDRAVMDSASGEKTIRAILAEVELTARLAEGADKRALYAFLGSLNEQVGNYGEASLAFATAAGIGAGDAPGMPHYSAEQLVINAVRCALSSGDYVTADNYLASQVKNSRDPTILAYVKLYALWSRLSQAQTGRDLTEPMNLLRSYAKDPAMEAVRPAVLLSIWYIDGDQESARLLIAQYPQSPETAIVQGKVTLFPAPFWYFSPRNTLASPGEPEIRATDSRDVDTPIAITPITPAQIPGREPAVQQPPPLSMRPLAPVESISPGMYQQLGLFRIVANARRLVDEVAAKGFSPILRSTVRNGETYYVVIVAENAGRTMGERLRAAGFECYPVYE